MALNCVPAINLFDQRCDRIHVTPQTSPTSTSCRPHAADGLRDPSASPTVTGYGIGLDSERRFLPALRRLPHRRAGPRCLLRGAARAAPDVGRCRSATGRAPPTSAPRSSSRWSTRTRRPIPADLQQIGVRALCHQPRPAGADADRAMPRSDLTLRTDRAGDVDPRHQRPVASDVGQRAKATLAWRLINQLSLNHLSLLDTDARAGCRRAARRCCACMPMPAMQRNSARSMVCGRSLRTAGGAAPADARADRVRPWGPARTRQSTTWPFRAASAFLLGCVLERFFARHVSMNGFTETRRRVRMTRGDILIGRPRCGTRPIL